MAKPVLRPSWLQFQEELQDAARSQTLLLEKLIYNLSATEYGSSLGVKPHDDYGAFSSKVPIVVYDDISNWVERQKSEEGSIMVAEPVLFYEKTSGSSGPAKYIPYTKGLKDSFTRMFSIWLYDLLEHGPGFETGKVFLSVSPAFDQEQETERGIRIGLDDDAEYLNSWMKNLLKAFLVLPPSIKKLRDPMNFKHALAALLLAESRLEIISIWNPSLLEILLDYIEENSETLCRDLKTGSIARENQVFDFNPISDDRLKLIESRPLEGGRIWPHLKLISCWTSANAGPAARGLGEKFPGVLIQGKGLLATEAPLTLPLIEADGFAPLPSEVFYEFLDDEGNISLLHELEVGREYEITLSQKSGLCRYRLGDRVRVTHHYFSTPCLEFIGRADAVCDMVGEKLNENFVRDCLSRLKIEPAGFQTLLPVMSERGKCYYVLLVAEKPDRVDSIEEELDGILCESHHYRNARLLGQLAQAKLRVAAGVRQAYYDYFMSKGMKLGDIKHSFLIKDMKDSAKLIESLGIGL